MKKVGKRVLALALALLMAFTMIPAENLQKVYAAGNAPQVTYTFDQIKEVSNIPVMNVTLKDSGAYDTLKTVKDKQDIASFELVNTNGKGKDISLSATQDSTGKTTYPLTLKGRGNSSWTMPTGKKPYNIKFDKKQDLLGMGKAKSWCLISNWVDTTFMRNYMAYKMAVALGMGTPDCEMVALCIDGKFEGIYLLTEKVGLNEFRTETAGDGRDVNGDGIVTDIIVESDSRAYENAEPGAFTTDGGVYFVPKDPDAGDLKDSELSEIQREVNIMEQAVLTGTNYDQIIDVDSWVDTYIVNELAKNPDFGFGYQPCYSSSYLYFQEGGKVYAGPVWDFDIAYGRNNYGILQAEGYRDTAGTTGYLTNATKYYKELFENTDFKERVIRRWKEIRETIIPEWANETFRQGYEDAKKLSAYDFEIWGAYNKRVAGTYEVGRATEDFEGETAYVKNFIQERIAWLDTQWNVDEIEKKYSNGTWSRWDAEDAGGYTSYEALKNATDAGSKKNAAADIWDGGNGGTEKNETEVIVNGSQQTIIPGVALDKSITITMEPQKKKNSWDNNYSVVSNIYEWWKDKEGKSGIGSKKDLSITINESGRYIGLASQKWYIGGTTVTMGSETQVYIVDVGTDGSVTLHDGSAAVQESGRNVVLTDTKYGNIEASDGGYKVSFKDNQGGNTGTVIGGSGGRQFGIYIPAGQKETSEASLTVVKRHPDSLYKDVPLRQTATYIYAKGEKPAAWSVSGDAVIFDSETGKVTAVKAGTATITARSSDGMESSVKIVCTETVAENVEYEVDPTLGKYFGTDGSLKATKEEKGTWATMRSNTLTRFSYTFALNAEEVENAVDFLWKTKEGNEILGGAADYYVFMNGKPVFAATADELDYSIDGFNSGNTVTIKADSADYKGLYAYMNQKSGSTSGMLQGMKDFMAAGNNTLDIFVSSKEGGAAVRPYLSGMNKISSGGEVTVVPVTEVTLNKADATLKAGETLQLTAEVLPSNATNKTVIWKSSNEAVATVKDGLVTAVAEGKAEITAEADGKSAAAVITVLKEEEPEITVETVVINQGAQSVTLTEGEFTTLQAAVSPEGVKDATVTWSSSDDSIATVDAAGKVTARKAGTVEVKAVSNADNSKFDTIKIIVEKKVIPVSGVEINGKAERITLEETQSAVLTVVVTPANADNKAVIWKSSDDSVVTVNDSGEITAVAAGTAVITATSQDNSTISDTIEVVVNKKIVIPDDVKVTAVAFEKEALSLYEGQTGANAAYVIPDNATNKEVTYRVEDEKIAAVDVSGNVAAKAVGTTKVYAYAKEDNTIFASYELTVAKAPVTVTIKNGSAVTVEDLKSVTLTAEVTPVYVPDRQVTWTSLDETIATVDAKGVVTAKKPGTVTVAAISKYDTEKRAEIKVTVRPTAVNILANIPSAVEEGSTIVLDAQISPSVDDQSMVWSAANGTGEAVIEGNVLTGIKAGTVTVTVTSSYDPSVSVSKEITVIAKKIAVTGIELSAETMTLEELGTGEVQATVLPADASNQNVIWSTSDASVAAVLNGKIIAKAPGKAVITAKTEDGGFEKQVTVTVEKVKFELAVSEKEISMADQGSAQITVLFAPNQVPNQSLIWKSDDTGIVTVVGNGVLQAKKPGSTVVTATSVYDSTKTVSVKVTVVSIPVTVEITGSKYTTMGNAIPMTANVAPAVYDTSVTWSVTDGADGGKAHFDANGNLVPDAEGHVTVTAVSNYNSEYAASIEVEIGAKAEGITIYAPAYDKSQTSYPAGALVYNPADGAYYVYTNAWGMAYSNTGAFPGYGWVKVNADLSKPITATGGFNFGLGDIIKKGDAYYTPLGSGYWDSWIAAGGNNAYWNVIPKEYAQYIGVGFNYTE